MPELPPAGTIEVVPSILSADFNRLGEQVAAVEPKCHMLHLDVMDGHFVPNFTFGPLIIAHLRRCSNLFFDTHLMLADPLQYADKFAAAGSDLITFHLEADCDADEVIAALRKLNVKVGISIKPSTPVKALEKIVADVDMVLLMTVEPGFGGQSFLPDSCRRCEEVRKLLRDDQRLEVDGGIDMHTAPMAVAAGADTLVAGNAIFGQVGPVRARQAIQQACLSSQKSEL